VEGSIARGYIRLTGDQSEIFVMNHGPGAGYSLAETMDTGIVTDQKKERHRIDPWQVLVSEKITGNTL